MQPLRDDVVLSVMRQLPVATTRASSHVTIEVVAIAVGLFALTLLLSAEWLWGTVVGLTCARRFLRERGYDVVFPKARART